MYLTAAELMERFDESELAQVAPPRSMSRVDPQLFRAVILEEDTSAWAQDEIDAAEAGVKRIDEAISDAGQEVDGYIGHRYKLPSSPVPTLIKRLAANIARYHLHDDAATEDIQRRYKDAIRTLETVRDGRMSLGVDEPKSTKAGTPEFESSDVRWRRGESNGYV
jgi:phage gp36-like protein